MLGHRAHVERSPARHLVRHKHHDLFPFDPGKREGRAVALARNTRREMGVESRRNDHYHETMPAEMDQPEVLSRHEVELGRQRRGLRTSGLAGQVARASDQQRLEV